MAILHINFRSDWISRSVYPTVFLPGLNKTDSAALPYRTLYFLPGYSGGGLETAMFSNFGMFSEQYGIAVVLVDGENSFYTDDEQRGAMFSRFVGQELVEVTRSVLPLSSRREDTFLGGISMGGYGALINGIRFHDHFSRVAMLSPALGFKLEDDEPRKNSPVPKGELLATLGTWEEYRNSYRDYRHAALQAAGNGTLPELFLGCGLRDPLLEPARELISELETAGVSVARYEVDGGHDHTFWKKALDPMFRFLSGKEAV